MTYISVNKQTIYKNARYGTNDPPVCVRRTKSGKPRYGHEVVIHGPSRIVYSHDKPILKCGARLVIETDADVTLT